MKRLKQFYSVVIFAVALSFIAATAGANVSYTVKKGDTLQRISRKYKAKVSDIKKANHLKSAKLSIDMKLSVPASEKNRRIKYSSHNSGTNRHKSNTYIVRKGDTLHKIARRFKMSVDELKEINSLQGNSLKRGQKLYLAGIAPDTKESAAGPDNIYVEKPTRACTSARLEEVKELSTSEDVLADLSIKERLILFAKKMLHLPYHFGGNGAIGLDCSAFVQRVFSFVGQNIPRSAREQFNLGEVVDKEDLERGDLVFFKTYASFPSHVGIYLGNNLFIHASSLSQKITIDSLETPYYFRRFIGAKRIIPDADPGISETPAVKVN